MVQYEEKLLNKNIILELVRGAFLKKIREHLDFGGEKTTVVLWGKKGMVTKLIPYLPFACKYIDILVSDPRMIPHLSMIVSLPGFPSTLHLVISTFLITTPSLVKNGSKVV